MIINQIQISVGRDLLFPPLFDTNIRFGFQHSYGFLMISPHFWMIFADKNREAFVSGAFAHDPRWRACRNATLEFWGIETVNELTRHEFWGIETVAELQ